jgi:hypothetical protein
MPRAMPRISLAGDLKERMRQLEVQHALAAIERAWLLTRQLDQLEQMQLLEEAGLKLKLVLEGKKEVS